MGEEAATEIQQWTDNAVRKFRERHEEQYRNFCAMKARGFDTDHWWETVMLPQFDAARKVTVVAEGAAQ